MTRAKLYHITPRPAKHYGECTFCKKVFDKLIEHHIQYNPEVIVLICEKCHIMFHKTWKRRDGEEEARNNQKSSHQSILPCF